MESTPTDCIEVLGGVQQGFGRNSMPQSSTLGVPPYLRERRFSRPPPFYLSTLLKVDPANDYGPLHGSSREGGSGGEGVGGANKDKGRVRGVNAAACRA